MAVRNFDGSDDTIVWSAGDLSGCTFGTWAVIFRLDDLLDFPMFACFHSSGGSGLALIYFDSGATSWGIETVGSGSTHAGATIVANTWYLGVVRKATGTATPRFSTYNFTSTAWTHANGGASIPDWTAPGASGTIRMQFQSDTTTLLDGKMAARAMWANEVHWAADSSGDSAIEAAGLEDSAQNWVDEAPDALWLFNQDPLAAVDDIVGGADQSSVTGTDVVTGIDPPGFSFSLTAAPVPNLFVTRSNLQLR